MIKKLSDKVLIETYMEALSVDKMAIDFIELLTAEIMKRSLISNSEGF